MLLLFKLLFAHLVADFLLQPLSWVRDKEQKAFGSLKLVYHSLVHAALYALVLSFDPHYWLGFLVLVVSHYFIDGLKSYANGWLKKHKPTSIFNYRTLFVADQLLHLLLIYWVVDYYRELPLPIVDLTAESWWLLALALLLLTQVSSIIIKVFISRWAPLNVYDGEHSLANAGTYIGILERLFIFVFLVTNHWEGVGFLLAAKSVFRFGDLKEAHDRKLTEYILIGSLLSFGLAILISLAYNYLSAGF
ncbi:DUF3307 domain-containing protein [Kangiella sp. TOML190]|uniref:DUF3307 domain-containing protein n=1 Tax=Kangiella sp. TOML190 TaxID=2931351 RepID=UPI00203CE2DB|nr:DUF3307 domain-containing protein [Kangiella sp. TOML190]